MAAQIVNFSRPNKSVPWGFSIQGGKEFGCPLSVLRVTSGSIADRLGVKMGDLIIKINELPTEGLTHQQAILQIQNLQVVLEIKRSRNTENDVNDICNLPAPPPIVNISNFNDNCRISTSIGELPPPPSEFIPVKVASFPPPPPPAPKQYFPPPQPLAKVLQASVVPKSKEVSQEKTFTQPKNYGLAENNQLTNLPKVVLDTKNIELFKETLNEDNKKPAAPSTSLGNLMQNRTNNQDYASKDLVVQNTNLNKDSAICFVCKDHIKGSYIEANKKIYCSNHFCCTFCGKKITSNKFIETKEGILYCMEDFKNEIAPKCAKCKESVIEEQIMALGKCWHTRCFLCDHCKRPIPHGQFHVKEDNGIMAVYCERDYKEHYEIKCTACAFPIDSDDKYLLVSGKNYHVSCFKK